MQLFCLFIGSVVQKGLRGQHQKTSAFTIEDLTERSRPAVSVFSAVVSVDDGSVENSIGSPRVPSKAESRKVRRTMRRTLLCQTHDEDRGT